MSSTSGRIFFILFLSAARFTHRRRLPGYGKHDRITDRHPHLRQTPPSASIFIFAENERPPSYGLLRIMPSGLSKKIAISMPDATRAPERGLGDAQNGLAETCDRGSRLRLRSVTAVAGEGRRNTVFDRRAAGCAAHGATDCHPSPWTGPSCAAGAVIRLLALPPEAADTQRPAVARLALTASGCGVASFHRVLPHSPARTRGLPTVDQLLRRARHRLALRPRGDCRIANTTSLPCRWRLPLRFASTRRALAASERLMRGSFRGVLLRFIPLLKDPETGLRRSVPIAVVGATASFALTNVEYQGRMSLSYIRKQTLHAPAPTRARYRARRAAPGVA